MENNNLEKFKIKVFNTLKKKNELRYLDYEIDLSKNRSRFNFGNDIYLEFDHKIFVYYKEEEVLNNSGYGKRQYLSRENTLREFDSIEDAFDYIEYLQNIIACKQLEQFFYFEFKVRNQSLFQNFSFKIVNNKSTDDYIIRIDSSGSDFYIVICFFATYEFKVDFTPTDENWVKHKIKRYNHIDDLIANLECFTSYDLITIEESGRDMF
ncbi:hypothetical protein HYN56_09830 [Flavobacterium crocinum]|uniref:Uncharacterized protein n=1 Tax=Flavobacterium crocinum TaxID=2183896 RepID=A0A2S1YKB3_9FLAO|nr:hypothetical protein [Flavobacterium crocinum]AWK04514.1 hypothetical protein HYN56_09830 [Flavobacterium crocinum]